MDFWRIWIHIEAFDDWDLLVFIPWRDLTRRCAQSTVFCASSGTGAGDHSHYRFRGVSVDAVGQNVAGNGYLNGDHHLGWFCTGGAGVANIWRPCV
ncbi:hypothetical protein ACLBOM_14370 [Escherichia coli]